MRGSYVLKISLANSNQQNTFSGALESEDGQPDPQNVHEQIELTTFEDDLAVLPEHVPGEIPLPLQDTMQHTDAMMHSVLSFLRRPQLVHSFTFASAAKRPTNLLVSGSVKEFLVPQNMFTPMLRNKLDGFTSFRATAVLKLQVNAQPFQCGRLLMAAIPMPGLLGPRKDWILKTTTSTQCVNHVQMDIAKQTEVELRIPFISPFNSYNLIDGNYDWAELVVQVYSPLRQIGSNDLQCLLWGHFEDIVLGAPTSAPMIGTSSYAVQQSAPREQPANKVKSARAAEASSVLSPVAASIKGAGQSFIKSGSQIVNGVTDALAGFAGLFGWSKPVPNIPGNTVLIRAQENFTNCDYMDHSHTLALCKLNNIDNYTGLVGSNLDEMSFDFIKKIPQYVGNFMYSDKITYGTNLWQSAVSPTYHSPWGFTLKDGDAPEFTNFRQPTCLTYAIAPFAYWSGSLVYTFRFVKTDFHSGRVEVSFHPFRKTHVSTTDGRHEYVYRVILDLRENSEASITIPFISQQPWKRVAVNNDPFKEPDTDVNMSTAVGIVQVRALTPLMVANAVASSDIECVIEVRAGDDFRVQCPTSSPLLPYTFDKPATQQSGKVSKFKAIWLDADVEQSIPEMEIGKTYYIYVSFVNVKDSNVVWDLTITGFTEQFALSGYNSAYGVNTSSNSGFVTVLAEPKIKCNHPGVVSFSSTEGGVLASLAPGSVVTVDPYSPVWTTPYCPDDYPEHVKQQSGALVVPGTAETRTRAIEGYTPPSITGKDVDINRQDVSRYTSGEVFNSFRQLTRRFTWCLVNDIPANGNFRGRLSGLIRPPSIYKGKIGTTGKTQYVTVDSTSESQVIPSAMSYVAGMYAFYRGGVRLKTFVHPNRNTHDLISMSYRYLNNGNTVSNIDNYQSSFEPIAFELSSKAIGEFQFPYYSPCLLSVPWQHEIATVQFDQPQMEYTMNSSNHLVAQKICVAAAAADDFDCQLFIGPPPVLMLDTQLMSTDGKRNINAPEWNYSPTQIYLKTGQDKGQINMAAATPVTLDKITAVDLSPNDKSDGKVSYTTEFVTNQQNALAGVRNELAGNRAKRSLTRQVAFTELPLYSYSAEIPSSHDSDDELDFGSIAHRDRGQVGI